MHSETKAILNKITFDEKGALAPSRCIKYRHLVVTKSKIPALTSLFGCEADWKARLPLVLGVESDNMRRYVSERPQVVYVTSGNVIGRSVTLVPFVPARCRLIVYNTVFA